MRRNFVLILTSAGWIASAIVLQTSSRANSNTTRGGNLPVCSHPPWTARRAKRSVLLRARRAACQLARVAASRFQGAYPVHPRYGWTPTKFCAIMAPSVNNWVDCAVLRLTMLPLGRVSDTVQEAISAPAIVQRRLILHIATCGEGNLPPISWGKGGGLATSEHRCQS